MNTISVLNLKGGVGKTVSAINIAYWLYSHLDQDTLLIDADKQGNTSKFFSCHNYSEPSLADVLTKGNKILFSTKRIEGTETSMGKPIFDILPANMSLLRADREILIDCTKPQQTRLANALQDTAECYDYAVIDCAPDLSMSVINALVASQYVFIPVKLDKFALDGLELILEQMDDIRTMNPNVRQVIAFATQYQATACCKQAFELLHKIAEKSGGAFVASPVKIRKTCKVDESTFIGKPLAVYAPRSTAAQDYNALMRWFMDLEVE
jgi:chromosome partitioning protein